MTVETGSISRLERIVRGAVGAVGLVCVVTALAADWIGLDSQPTFGTGETLLLLTGLAVIAVAILGRRVGSIRRAFAVHLFDAAVLLVLLELALIAFSTLTGATSGIRGGNAGVLDQMGTFYLDMPYYVDQPWAATYWRENSEASARHYRPFVTWKRGQYSGETINIDEHGFRVVPGAKCESADAFRVDALGGSTQWGWGSRDGGTIPAHLQRLLDARFDRPVCVRNLGETGYVSTQELVQWMIVRRDDAVAGRPPADLVLFYDGINDTMAAHQAGYAGAHQNLSQIVGRLEGAQGPVAAIVSRLQIVGLLRGLLPAVTRPTHGVDSTTLARDVVDTWLGVVEAASSQAGTSRVIFFWQPVLGVSEAPITQAERAVFSDALARARDPDPPPQDLLQKVWGAVSQVSDPRVIDLQDVFDADDASLWIDPWGHVTPEGNALVAQRMVEALEAVGALPAELDKR